VDIGIEEHRITITMNKEWLFCIILLVTIVILPSFITPIAYFTYEHEILDGNTAPYDALIVVLSLFCGILPMMLSIILFIKCFGSKEESGLGITIRYVLSKLRVPGFWGASVRNKKSFQSKERVKDCCAIITYFGYFVFLTVVFYTLVGALIYDSDVGVQRNTTRLLNGTILFKPDIDPSREGTRVRVYTDLGEIGLANDTTVGHGPTIKRTGTNVTLDSVNPYESFGYTLTPGSLMKLTVTATSNMTVYYKKDDDVIEDNVIVPSFKLSVNETNCTSHLINISYPGDDEINISFAFELKSMLYNVESWILFKDHGTIYVPKDKYLAITRKSADCAGKEFIDIDVQTRDLLVDTLYTYQWTWMCTVIYLCPILMFFVQVFTLFLVGYHSGDFTETPSEEKRNMCNILGHINMVLLLGVGMAFFTIGITSSEDEEKIVMGENTMLDTEFFFYAGEQVIFPVNDTENPGLSYKSDSEEIKISALTEFPNSTFDHVIDCNPGSFYTDRTWYNNFYIQEGYSLVWDFDTSHSVDVQFMMTSNGKYSFQENNVMNSTHQMFANETGVYQLSVRPRSYGRVLLTFHNLDLNGFEYNVSKQQRVWSTEERIYAKKLEESVKYLIVESAEPNITPAQVHIVQFEFDDHLRSCIEVGDYSLGFTLVFVFLIIIAFIFIFIEAAGVGIPCCYICADMSVSEDGEKTSLVKSNNKSANEA